MLEGALTRGVSDVSRFAVAVSWSIRRSVGQLLLTLPVTQLYVVVLVLLELLVRGGVGPPVSRLAVRVRVIVRVRRSRRRRLSMLLTLT